MKLLTVVGARPQFIKAATVSRAIKSKKARDSAFPMREIIIHTGQHHDDNMSEVFFRELSIPEPDYNLGIGGLSHGAMTGRMLEEIEKIIFRETPDMALVYGDTNSTLAGALAAVKTHIPIAHVEAGLRSFDKKMPEEINRVVTDRVSDILLCPTEAAVKNLEAEGITAGVKKVGDVMYDASLFYRDTARNHSRILDEFGLVEKEFILATIHRAENTDNEPKLARIVAGLAEISEKTPVVLPMHPRTSKMLEQFGLKSSMGKITVIPPVSYLDMIRLEQTSRLIVTDSGGVQKEAYFFRVPCVTVRDRTEWIETIDSGWNSLTSPEGIIGAVEVALQSNIDSPTELYGDGAAAGKIVDIIMGFGK